MLDFKRLDAAREHKGFLSIDATMELGTNNTILDPFSVLISSNVTVGDGNVFYPGVTVNSAADAQIDIGNGNEFHSGTLLIATHGGISIGSHNQFGDGGFTAKSNRPGAFVVIGDRGRYANNPSVFGETRLEDGSQILGNIVVDSCILESGASFEEIEPDKRGAVLKGWGVARMIRVARGHVINGEGNFDEEFTLPQSHFHPKVK